MRFDFPFKGGLLKQPRLLPLVIAASAVAAPFYAIGVSSPFGDDARPTQVAANEVLPGVTDLLADPPAGALPAPASATLPAPPSAGGGKAPAKPVAAAGSCDPALADMLAAERKALAERQTELDMRAQMLSAAEQKAREQLARLEQAGREVSALLDRRSSMAKADLQRLVTIYENMKPKDAARLLNEADPLILVDLMDLMQERRSAPILAEMDPVKVNALTRTMAERRVLPADRPPQKPKTQTASLPAR
ncbi:MotE family protein [Oleisolibacter albus]|uniref:MotE family protein n=1 Tax=Oleisolibacter albus TaxID=2171757 RepID=UPI000DF3AD05|nr:hypothetical protein [Oleisolibacter albus]